MPQWFDAGFVLPNGTIAERWRIEDEHASAFIERTKRFPTMTLTEFREWMINHRGVLVEPYADH